MSATYDLFRSLRKITPCIDGLRRNLLREGTPERAYFFDLGVAENVKDEIAQYMRCSGDQRIEGALQREVAVYRHLGYDVFRTRLPNAGRFETSVVKGEGANSYPGVIRSWEDFECFDWPRVRDVDFAPLEWFEKNLPSDMGVTHTVCVWETARQILGFENLCLCLYDQPELVDAVFEKVGEYYTELAKHLVDFACVFSLFGADDLGYKTSTLLPPDTLRRLVLPWHKQWATTAHKAGKLYFLHSCGKIDALMEDLIVDVNVDAKHSFEDVIEPVTEAKRKYGARLSLLGGLDVDFLARGEEGEIRTKVREILDQCMPGGGYCLGSGNWITSYIPLYNYLVMLDEGRRWCES